MTTSNPWQPNFDLDLERGKVGEELLGTFLGALADGAKFEVKTDYRAVETGNFYIETWQYNWSDMSDKRPSGINTTEAEWWVFAGPGLNGFVAIKTADLKDIIRETNPREAQQPITNDTTNGSFGRLVKVQDVLRKIGLVK
jgi:hypothetical protein